MPWWPVPQRVGWTSRLDSGAAPGVSRTWWGRLGPRLSNVTDPLMALTATISNGQLPPELELSRIEVREGLSQLFVVYVECLSWDPDWELAALLGTETCVALLE